MRSLIVKSRNNPASQLNTPGARRFLKPELPSAPARQEPGLFGSKVSAKAKGSYQKPEWLTIFLGLTTISIIVGELPGQEAPQSPHTLKGGPVKTLTTLFTCQPEITYDSAPLSASQRWPLPRGTSHTLVMARLCVRSKPVVARFIFIYAND